MVKKYVCIPRSFLVINVCNQGKTLRLPCIYIFYYETQQRYLTWKELKPNYYYYYYYYHNHSTYHKKGDKIDCNNYRGISLLPTTYKILSNILLSRLIPYAKEVIGDHQCGFRRNRSTIDHIFCIRQILEKKMGIQW